MTDDGIATCTVWDVWTRYEDVRKGSPSTMLAGVASGVAYVLSQQSSDVDGDTLRDADGYGRLVHLAMVSLRCMMLCRATHERGHGDFIVGS